MTGADGESRPLTQAEIITLGIRAGHQINNLPDDFCGSKDPQKLEEIKLGLAMTAIGFTDTQIVVPEEIDLDDQI